MRSPCFQVVVGEDPDDPVTAASRGRAIPKYADSLVKDGLKGARIGILRQAYERDTTDPEVVQVFMRALDDLRKAGATIVDPAQIEAVRQDGRRGLVRWVQVRHQQVPCRAGRPGARSQP